MKEGSNQSFAPKLTKANSIRPSAQFAQYPLPNLTSKFLPKARKCCVHSWHFMTLTFERWVQKAASKGFEISDLHPTFVWNRCASRNGWITQGFRSRYAFFLSQPGPWALDDILTQLSHWVIHLKLRGKGGRTQKSQTSRLNAWEGWLPRDTGDSEFPFS